MNSKNICKFPMQMINSGELSINCFVKETDEDIMKASTILKAHRLLICLDGNGTLAADGSLFTIRRGSIIFFFCGEAFSLKSGKNLIYEYIDFDGSRADELFRRFDVTPLSRLYEGFEGAIPLWQESLIRSNDKTLSLAAESIVLYTFSRLYESGEAENGLISQIMQITEENFSDSELNVTKIATELSYNPKYISHMFKEKTGVGYSEYLRTVRLKYATTLFDRGIDSVKNVALLSGFSDSLYFSNVFKRHIGMSPTQYLATKKQDSK